jgi:uncharacterized protein (UPF0305 family)
MPTPQEKSLFVEQASCLFLRMVQDLSRGTLEDKGDKEDKGEKVLRMNANRYQKAKRYRI